MFSVEQWDAVQKGMNWVVNTSANSLNRLYGNLGVTVAGKMSLNIFHFLKTFDRQHHRKSSYKSALMPVKH